MKVFYSTPPSHNRLVTQGDLLFGGALNLGINAHADHFETAQEQECYLPIV